MVKQNEKRIDLALKRPGSPFVNSLDYPFHLDNFASQVVDCVRILPFRALGSRLGQTSSSHRQRLREFITRRSAAPLLQAPRNLGDSLLRL
jgi:hypothetical protein